MAIIEILIDKTSLPNDGDKVRWQTQEDFDHDRWREGTYSNDDPDGDNDPSNAGLFLEGFGDTATYWNCAWKVLHWELIQ